jgi:hypothetical protein
MDLSEFIENVMIMTYENTEKWKEMKGNFTKKSKLFLTYDGSNDFSIRHI